MPPFAQRENVENCAGGANRDTVWVGLIHCSTPSQRGEEPPWRSLQGAQGWEAGGVGRVGRGRKETGKEEVQGPRDAVLWNSLLTLNTF